MSLFIVGSCSRITRNIILSGAAQYKKVTICDLLPTYNQHYRFYNFRKELAEHRSPIDISISKLTQYEDVYNGINSHDDALYVTHDYFNAVISKTKLMKLVAEFGKKKSHLYFATPAEYDHFGFANPEENYLNAQKEVLDMNPNATIIRSDVQDGNELYAYINKSKKIWQEKLLEVPHSFRPNVVNSSFYAKKVIETMKEKVQGKVICVRGSKETPAAEVAFNRELSHQQIDHVQQNTRDLVKKYRGVDYKNAQLIVG